MSLIGSFSGRLVRSLNKNLTHIRWMGCKVAVYDLTSPREIGVKVRKHPSHRRGRNRRGSRGSRGGRKRRALVSDAPVHLGQPDFTARGTGKSSKRRFERKQNYSATLIRFFVSESKRRERYKEKVRTLSNNAVMDVDAWDARLKQSGRSMKLLRRSWLKLARISGDSHEFCMIRHRVLVLGIDEFSKAERSKLGTQARIKLEADWLGELVPEVVKVTSKDEERPADAVYECTKCNRVTNINICRMCGSDLSRPGRLNDRRSGRKPGRNPSFRGNRASKSGGNLPIRPSPRR